MYQLLLKIKSNYLKITKNTEFWNHLKKNYSNLKNCAVKKILIFEMTSLRVNLFYSTTKII